MPGWLIIMLLVGGGGFLVVLTLEVTAVLSGPRPSRPDPRKAEERTRGSLVALRSPLSVYYGDLQGLYPADMRSLTVAGKYLSTIQGEDLGIARRILGGLTGPPVRFHHGRGRVGLQQRAGGREFRDALDQLHPHGLKGHGMDLLLNGRERPWDVPGPARRVEMRPSPWNAEILV